MHISTLPGLVPSCLTYGLERKALPFPLQAQMQTRFVAARYGIYHLIRSLVSAGRGTVLVPDYHHGNEVRAIRAAGATIRFYNIGRDLQPGLEQVEQLCRSGAKVLYVIHYIGWPQPLSELAALCRHYDMLMIEDCALSMLSKYQGQPLGSVGDFSVFCLYKTLPVPNGGVLVQNRNVFPELTGMKLEPCGALSVLSQSTDMMLERLQSISASGGRALLGLKRAAGRVSRRFGSRRIPVGNAGFNVDHANVAASNISNRLLHWLDYEAILRRRRANYQSLAERLGGKMTAAFRNLDDSVCPLFYPLLVSDKRASAETLWSRGIGAVEFWNDGDSAADPQSCPDAHYLRRHLLELPIHQDLSPRQIDYIAREAETLEPVAR